MGPKHTCSYADIAMGEIDFKAKFCGRIKPSPWWRYRDDVFDLWYQGIEKLEAFTNYRNSLYPTIKFKLVYSDKSLNVLDITLIWLMVLSKQTLISNPLTAMFIYFLVVLIRVIVLKLFLMG